MGEFLKSEKTIRDYLLGRISDETVLQGIEDLLFTDEEYCSQVALEEDGLINNYVLGRLNDTDADSFRRTLELNPERRFKLMLTEGLRERALAGNPKTVEARPSFFDSLASWFRQPKYAGAFAVFLILVLASAVYFTRRSSPDHLAELRSIYQQSRPTQTRISEFGYAPLTQLRGAPEAGDERRLRRIENNLLDAAEQNPNAQTHHALGVYYLTQKNYREAIKEFENALKFAESAQIHNDLGVAHFEFSKTAPPEKKLVELAQSLEEFTKATELDNNFLEALFNKSLALQELNMPRQAKESWALYLQKDPSSPWAEEARKHLERLQTEEAMFRTKDQILSDFLTAYRNSDYSRAQNIHHHTKGLLGERALPLQLSRRYLISRHDGSDGDARESLNALTYLGNSEQAQNGDSFFFELANFYASVGPHETGQLLQAKDTFAGGMQFMQLRDLRKAVSELEKSRNLFRQAGNECEAVIAESWAIQFLIEVGKLEESRQRFEAMIDTAQTKNFKILLPKAYYWLGVMDFRQNRLSDSNKNFKAGLRLAEAGNNKFEVQHALDALIVNYMRLSELEPALVYAGKMFADKADYYQDENQYWRNQGRLADLSLTLKLYSTSLSLSRERLNMVRETDSGSSRVNDSLRPLIRASAARKDFPSALNYASESLAIAQKRGESPENTRTIAEIYLVLAELKGQTDCAEALADYDKALELYTRLPEVTDSLYRIHRGKLLCLDQLNQQPEFVAELDTVLKLSEKYRATIREDSSRQAFFAKEQEVFDVATASALKAGDLLGAFHFAEDSKARSLLGFVESGKSITEAEKNFGPVAQPLSLAKIQSRLPDQVQLVQYAVLKDKLAIWIVSKTRFDLLERQIDAAQLENKIEAYQALILGKRPLADIKEAARDLYGLLIPSGLAVDKQLCVIPDKFLHQLAFATLVSPTGKYLLEDYSLSYAPSASVLVLASESARRREAGNERLLSVGNPAFDHEDNPNLADLQSAEAEAKTIAAGYHGSQELLGNAATKEQFLRNFASVEVVHFAGHFVTNAQSPGNSKLLFAGGELRSSELSQYKLSKAKLVVLSACETGFELYNKSEGAIGVARTLLALGSPLVVASQWRVDSEPTKDLMIAFHRNRKEKGLTSAESLRKAQLEMLSREHTQAPFYWAAFSLFGGYANY
ncbi:MAG TPA: CHAT domain-containing protein [Pyrinomonadaceae bacterium]|nr:CHAT domain-containing protein [Pyrinomonadaceae bacterium]